MIATNRKAVSLNTAQGRLDLSRPVCMGIMNVTPDSFFDGATLGSHTSSGFRVDLDRVLHRAERMVSEGARLLDIGGESTRPGAANVSPPEEIDRVLPVVEALRERIDVFVSVDTSTPEVICAAAAAGAGMINDVRALQRPGAAEAVCQAGFAVCLMHMLGEPGTMQDQPEYEDVTAEVAGFLCERADAAVTAGIHPENIVIDPGFGFGKTTVHNFTLLRELGRFAELGYPLLAGVSRKSMIGAATGRMPEERLPGSIAAAMLVLQGGASIIRSHDVAATVDAIGVHSAFRKEH